MLLFLLLITVSLASLSSCADNGESASVGHEPLAIARPHLTNVSKDVQERVNRAYQQAVENSDDPAAVGHLGMILHAYEKDESAAECYRRASELAPHDFRWSYLHSVVLGQRGQAKESIQVLQRALAVDPDNVPARLRLAQQLLDTGRVEESRKVYSALLQDHLELSAAHLGLGRIESVRGRPRKALGHYRRASAALKDYGPLHYLLAGVYRELGEEQKAKQAMEVFKQLGPTRKPPFADPLLDEIRSLEAGSYQHHLTEGRRLEAAGRPREAAEQYRRAVAIEPERAQAHVNLVSAYGSLGEFDKAEQHYEKAIAINANLEEAHYNFGVLKTMQSRFREAARAFERALKINPFSADAHNNLGYALERLGNQKKARFHYRAALENQPNSRLAHFNLGRHLFGIGEREQAIRHLLQTLSPEDEQTPQFLLVLARAYRALGNDQKARQYGGRAKSLARRYGQKQIVALAEREFNE